MFMAIYTIIYGFILMFILSGAVYITIGSRTNPVKKLGAGEKIIIWLILLYIPIMISAFIR